MAQNESKSAGLRVVDPRPRPVDIRQGRRFRCQRSGRCCRQDGYVYVTLEELSQIADLLGLSEEEFRTRYAIRRHQKSGMDFLEASGGKGCPLLTTDGRCSVHERKPKQCSTWPFWPELLQDEKEWEDAKRVCIGIDIEDGELYTEEQILEIRGERLTTKDADVPFDGDPSGYARPSGSDGVPGSD